MFNGANLSLSSDVDQDTCRKVTQKKVSKGAKIRNRYNQVPQLTQDTNEQGKKHNIQES